MLDPTWNKFVKEYDRALDPLGMNRATDRMLNDLLMGITTVTPRARYYSFYVWAIDQIVKNDLGGTPAKFRTSFSNLERVFMLSCVAHEEESEGETNLNHNDVNGSSKGWQVWKDAGVRLPLDFSFFGHMLGGFGQYYRGTMARLGLIAMENEGNLYQTTELGRTIAQAFDKSANGTILKIANEKDSVSKEELCKSGRKVCLCRLESNPQEKKLLTDLFFGFSDSEDRPNTIRRRNSLSLVLHLSRQFKMTSDIWSAGQDLLDASYFGQVWDYETKKVVSIKIPPHLIDLATRWKVFRSHDYFAFAAESLLTCFLEYLDEKPQTGGTVDAFLRRATGDDLESQFCKLAGMTGTFDGHIMETPLSHIMDRLAKDTASIEGFTNRLPDSSKEFDRRVKIRLAFGEFAANNALDRAIYGGEGASDRELSGVYYSWPVLMIAVFMRFYWMYQSSNDYWLWLLRHTGRDPGVARFIADLDKKLKVKPNFTFRSLISWFIETFVISEAKRIYAEKLSNSPFSKPKSWFHSEGDSFKKDREYFAGYRNFRFASAVTILRDLGLLKFSDDILHCTNDGARLLDIVEREAKKT